MSRRVTDRLADFLYKKICAERYSVLVSRQVETDLQQLHPGEAAERVRAQYYEGKISLFLKIVLLGTVLAAGVGAKEWLDVQEERGTILLRGSPGEAEEQIAMKARYGESAFDFKIQLAARQQSEDEAVQMMEQLLSDLPEYILGKNESLEAVTCDLLLYDSYESLPVIVEWESSCREILSEAGKVQPTGKREKVILTANLFCGDYGREGSIEVTVLPQMLSEEEQIYRELAEYLVEVEETSRLQEGMELPETWNGKDIVWSRRKESKVLLLWGGAVAAAVLVYFCSDRDLHEKLQKKRKILEMEYPNLLHELVLLVGAGMTTKGAFRKMAEDYEKKKAVGGDVTQAYEELLYMCREMQSGIAEGAAYERFGRRTGVQQYIRLSGLLMQNLKRGNGSLLERLHGEADKAGEERLQQSKKLGEEAGTKLLVPMVMMLAVVMILIMIPAFSGI